MHHGWGGQRRYNKTIADCEIPVGARRHVMDTAHTIHHHVQETGLPGIYTAAGTWRGPIDDQLFAPMLDGPDRVRRVDGEDTSLAAFLERPSRTSRTGSIAPATTPPHA